MTFSGVTVRGAAEAIGATPSRAATEKAVSFGKIMVVSSRYVTGCRSSKIRATPRAYERRRYGLLFRVDAISRGICRN
jgi:hypothetical protein